MKRITKIKTVLAAILAVCSLMNLTGCSENKPGDHHTENLILGADVTKTQYSPITLSDNNTENSIRLFDAIIKDKKNAMFSPLSLNMALGLIEAGAKGETKAELDAYLQTENFTEFAENYMRIAREERSFKSNNGKENNVFEIANSLWTDKDITIKDDYRKTMTEKFGAEIQSVDFGQKDKTISTINGWVNEKTHKMIPSILDGYGDEIKSVLINTVYFESAWSKEWKIDEKRDEDFTLLDGTTEKIPLMYNGGSAYFENGKATAFSCNYKNSLEFIGILPNDSGDFTLEGLDIPALLDSRSYDYDVSAVMPRLEFESSFPLKAALMAAGFDTVFDRERADFSGISESTYYMWVDDILQKTKLELDEKKTKAAAVTGILSGAADSAPVVREHRTVRLDRPFAFMIYDFEEEQILFIGKVTDPEAKG